MVRGGFAVNAFRTRGLPGGGFCSTAAAPAVKSISGNALSACHRAKTGSLVFTLRRSWARQRVFRDPLSRPLDQGLAFRVQEVGQLLLARLQLLLELLVLGRLRRLEEGRRHLWVLAAGKDAVEGVVVARRDGVELVVMTAG